MKERVTPSIVVMNNGEKLSHAKLLALNLGVRIWIERSLEYVPMGTGSALSG